MPGADLLDGEAGLSFAATTKNRLAAALKAHPQRFRIMFSVDYPYSSNQQGRRLLLSVSPADKEKIARQRRQTLQARRTGRMMQEETFASSSHLRRRR
jgi:hypothetical protein